MKLWAVAFSVLLIFGGAAHANPLEVEYGSFYSHLKKLNDKDFPALQFTFGFKQVQSVRLCDINSVNIVTPKLTIPIVPTAEKRFLLPTEKALRQANALVSIDLVQPNNQCDMSVQLETKAQYLKPVYTSAELEYLYSQYADFYDDMGSFLSFLMPDVIGLQFHFQDQFDIDEKSTSLFWQNGRLHVGRDVWQKAEFEMSLPSPPIRITAITEK